jgi:hypothetical protein
MNEIIQFMTSIVDKNIAEIIEKCDTYEAVIQRKFDISNSSSLLADTSLQTDSLNTSSENDAKLFADELTDMLSLFKIDDLDVKTSSERFVMDHFDRLSTNNGLIINRKGAGMVQNIILKDTMVVNSVKMFKGAVIFNGQLPVSKSYKEFSAEIENKLYKSNFYNEIDYVILMDEKIPVLELVLILIFHYSINFTVHIFGLLGKVSNKWLWTHCWVALPQ